MCFPFSMSKSSWHYARFDEKTPVAVSLLPRTSLPQVLSPTAKILTSWSRQEPWKRKKVRFLDSKSSQTSSKSNFYWKKGSSNFQWLPNCSENTRLRRVYLRNDKSRLRNSKTAKHQPFKMSPWQPLSSQTRAQPTALPTQPPRRRWAHVKTSYHRNPQQCTHRCKRWAYDPHLWQLFTLLM